MFLNFNFITIVIYATFFSYLKDFGAYLLVPIFLLSTLAFVRNDDKSFFLNFNIKYLIFVFYALIILFLSQLNFMPKSWTILFDRIIALRQFFFILTLPIFMFISYNFFSNYLKQINKKIIFLLIAYLCIVGINDHLNFGKFNFFSTLTNSTIIWLLLLLIFFEKYNNKYFTLLSLTLIFVISNYWIENPSLQFNLLLVFLFLIYLTNRNNIFTFGLTFVCIIIPFIPGYFLNFLENYLDENTKVRLVLWIDAISALYDTYGFGVGFGTEWIKNEFYQIKSSSWVLFEFSNFNRMINTTTHSSFSDIYFRIGIIGFILFLNWFKKFFQTKMNKNNLYGSSMIIIILSFSTNPGLFSVNFYIGLSIALGLVINLIKLEYEKS